MTTTTPAVTVRPTTYAVSALPDDHPDADVFTITVEWRSGDWWIVRRASFYLTADGRWDPNWPTCFPLDEALDLAREWAPKLTVNRWTVTDALARGNREETP